MRTKSQLKHGNFGKNSFEVFISRNCLINILLTLNNCFTKRKGSVGSSCQRVSYQNAWICVNSFMTEVPIISKPVYRFAEQINGLVYICRADQWTGFYMIGMKELKRKWMLKKVKWMMPKYLL